MSKGRGLYWIVQSITSIFQLHSLSLFFAISGTVIALSKLTPFTGWGDDWAAYVEQGIALATGTLPQQQYDMHFCLDNSSIPLGPYAYPWGLPLVIAGLFPKTGFSVMAFKAINLVFGGLFLFLFHASAIQRTNRSVASILTTLFVVHPVFLIHMNLIGSDIPFLFFSFSSVLALEHIVSHSNHRLGSICFLSVLGGMGCAMAFLFRTNGIVILVALTCVQVSFCMSRLFPDSKCSQAIRNSVRLNGPVWIQFLPLLVSALCVLLLKATLTIGGDGHISMLAGVSFRTILGHSFHYMKVAAGWFAIPALSPSVSFVLGLLVIAVSIFAGFVHLKTHPLEVLFVAETALCYVVWPAKQGIRFLLPLIPFILLWIGDIASAPIWNRHHIVKAMSLFAGAVLSIFCIRTMESIWKPKPHPLDDPYAPNAMEAFSFIQQQTPANAVVAFRKPRVLHLLARRKSFAPGFDVLRTNPDCLLLVDRINDQPDWIKEIDRHVSSGAGEILFENAQFILLKSKGI